MIRHLTRLFASRQDQARRDAIRKAARAMSDQAQVKARSSIEAMNRKLAAELGRTWP